MPGGKKGKKPVQSAVEKQNAGEVEFQSTMINASRAFRNIPPELLPRYNEVTGEEKDIRNRQ